MPIYAYRCEDCGHAQDFLQKMSDPLIEACPSCASKNFRKQVTAAGFQLKGGGWYVTDFRDNGKKDAKKSTDGGADKSASTETKSDSKPAESSTTPAPSTTTAAPAPSTGGDTKAA
jgi:putative FmdB family regulatory protein